VAEAAQTDHLGYSEYPDREKRSGFGFSAGLGEPEVQGGCKTTFSWEWSQVAGANRARKLQEAGSLTFEESDTPCARETTHMRFDTDVSFRISRAGGGDPYSAALETECQARQRGVLAELGRWPTDG
jgi:hypothetical protein